MARGWLRVGQGRDGKIVSCESGAAAVENPLINRRAVGQRGGNCGPTGIARGVHVGIGPAGGKAISGVAHDHPAAIDADVDTAENVGIGSHGLDEAAPLMVDVVGEGPGAAAVVGAVDAEKSADGAEDVNGGRCLPRGRCAERHDAVGRCESGRDFGKARAEVVE